MSADVDTRYIVVGKAGTLPAKKKEVADVFDYLYDYLDWLLEGEGLSSATASVDPAGPTLGTPVIAGTIVELRISGGTSATKYTVTVTATMTDGQSKTTKMSLQVL